jgi:signal transduction histidine kinase
MDLRLRTKLLLGFVVVALVGGGLCVGVGLQVIGDLATDPHQRQQAAGLLLSAWLGGLGLAIGVGCFLAWRLGRPLETLMRAATRIEQGDLTTRVPEAPRANQDEIKRLQKAFNVMAGALQERHSQLQDDRERLATTADELGQWNQSYLDTLAFVTHELKNQIAGMKLNLLAVRQEYVGPLNGEQKEALDDVMLTMHRAEEMLMNYLNLSRIEKGELQIRTRPVQVGSEIVEPVLRSVSGRLRLKQMRVEVDLPPELVVQADPTLFQTVYENLLSNAAKYGREGGLVRVWGQRLNGMVELHVWNEGPGVAAENLGQLFGKFSRLTPPGEQERGHGLGLFIDREIVRKHGGKIRAESEFGEWIDFIFTMPRPDEMMLGAVGDELAAGDEDQ